MGVSDYTRVAAAIQHLEAARGRQPGLAELARQAGLSPFHFQRMFSRWAGVSPKAFLQALTLERAKAILAEAPSLLDAALATGLSGPGRLHDLFITLEAMTPGQARRGGGLTLRWGVHPTPFGDALFAASPRGLCGLTFLEAGPEPALADLAARWPEARLQEDPGATRPAAQEVATRMAGGPRAPLSLVLRGSPFQLQVWQALLAIPEGRLASYQGLAALAGHPGASRAAGTALGANPLAYLIPCHRVIRATGLPGSYRWGALRKEALLRAELARAEAS